MLKQIKRIFNRSMVVKLSITNSVIVILAFCSVGIIMGIVNSSISISREKQIMELNLRNTINTIDNKLKEMARVSLMVFSDETTQAIMENFDSYDYREQQKSLEYLQNLYMNLFTIRKDITGTYLFDNNNLIFSRNTYGYTVKRNYNMQDFIYWLEQTEMLSGRKVFFCKVVISPQPDFLLYSSTGEPYEDLCIYFVRDVKTFSPHVRIGHILLVSSAAVFKETFFDFYHSYASWFLINEDNSIIYSENTSKLGRDIKELEPDIYSQISGNFGHFNAYLDGRKNLVSYTTSPYSGITLVVSKSLMEIYKNTFIFIRVLLLVITAFVFIVIVFTRRFTRTIIRPIKALSAAMVSFSKENMGKYLAVDSEDEVGQITRAFNTMKKTINDLIISEYEKTIKLGEMQLEQKEMQFQNLRNQINPHFLYNTLDNIRIKAALNGDNEVSEMIMLLVEFFRGNMELINHQIVFISQEINLIRVYLDLMRKRYPDLNVTFDLDSELNGIMLPGFILQPLVENSLLHGLKLVHYKGVIKISTERDAGEQNTILIKIADNGVGLSTSSHSAIKSLLAGEEVKEEKNDYHVGIQNVQKRLRMFYPKECGLFYDNNLEGGVTVTIKIKDHIKNM